MWQLPLLGVVYLVAMGLGDDQIYAWLNSTLPLVLLVLLAVAAYHLIGIDPTVIWTPLPWFMAAAAMYFGLGPLMYYYGSPSAIALAEGFAVVDDYGIIRANFLNIVAISTVLATFAVLLPRVGWKSRDDAKGAPVLSMHRTAVLFLMIGIPIRYLLIMPWEFGLLGFNLPGTFMNLKQLVLLGVLLLAATVKRRDTGWIILLVVVTVAEVVASVITFGKQGMLLAVIMPVLGLFIRYKSRRVLLLAAPVVVLFYLAATPMVTSLRSQAAHLTAGGSFSLSYQDRIDLVGEYFRYGALLNVSGQSWWNRLNYTHIQAFVMDEYDLGSRGSTLKTALYTPIPRFIWRNKPVLSNVGNEFNYLVIGNTIGATSPGVFAEAYWNGGWLGVVGVCMGIGAIIAGFARYTMSKMSVLDVWYLPVIFLGIRMGFRPDGMVVGDYIGPLMIAVALHLVLSSSRRLLARP